MIRKLSLVAALVFSASTALAEVNAATRFGTLTTSEDNTLLFKGRPLTPSIQGNNGLVTIGGPYPIGASDVVLIEDEGGLACPALLYFVTVTAAGAKATRSFGTCSDQLHAEQQGDVVKVTMTGYKGPGDTEANQRKAAREKHVFTFRNGVVTESRASGASTKARKPGRSWQDENGFMHHADGTVSSAPVD